MPAAVPLLPSVLTRPHAGVLKEEAAVLQLSCGSVFFNRAAPKSMNTIVVRAAGRRGAGRAVGCAVFPL